MKQGFLYGTLILVGAGFITKILGFIYRVALSRIIGDEGMGIFQMTFPILLFALVITTAGIPIAISKLVSEAIAKKEEYRIRSILITSTVIVIILSIIVTICVLLAAPFIANYLLTDNRAIYSLLSMAPIIPIIAISSIFRGYFQGRQNMSPYALSTIIEQSLRIFTVIVIATYLLPYGIEYAAAGAMIGMVIGEFAGMVYLSCSYFRDPKNSHILGKKKVKTSLAQYKQTLRELFQITIPVTASRFVSSLAYAIEPIVVAQSLAIAGIATATSTALYGQFEGMAIPLIFFPAFITYALSVSLVPAISEAAAQKNKLLLQHRFQQAIRLCLIVGAPCAVIIFMLAEPLATILYRQVEVGRLMKIMAPFAVLLYLQGPLSSVLQGMDMATVAMRNSIYGAVIKTLLICILASQATLGIDGVAIAINTGIIVVTILHFLSIVKIIPYTINLKEIFKLMITIIIMGIIAYELVGLERIPLLIRTFLTLSISFTAYFLCLLLFRLVKKEDFLRLPYLGPWLARYFQS